MDSVAVEGEAMSLSLQRDILLWRASVCEGSQMDQDDGRPLRLDPEATSANPNLPGFLARPEDAPVYHGFPILEDVEVDGFRLGMITDWEAEPADGGDAFVVARQCFPYCDRSGRRGWIRQRRNPRLSECSFMYRDRVPVTGVPSH